MDKKFKSHKQDKILINKVLSGDTNAFGTIIKNSERLVAQIVFKMIANADERKDIAQDVYLKVYKNLPVFRYQSKLTTWIAQVTYRTCLHFLEKRKIKVIPNIYPSDDSRQDNTEMLAAKNIDLFTNETEKLLFAEERSKILELEIESLSPIYKTLISLYHNEEMSYAEIAEITQLPEGTVKSYLFRARKTLKENLLRKYKREEL